MSQKGLLAATAAFALTSSAQAVTISFPDFSDTSGLQLNGSAAAAVDSAGRDVLRVTPSINGQSGSAFTTSPISLGGDVSFSSAFSFRFSQPGSGGADGLAFVVQTNSASVGSAGGGIGYQGIPNSVAVEFDNWNNGFVDQNSSNHVGINLNGSIASSPLAHVTEGVFDHGGVWNAWVDYDGTSDLLEVRLTQSSTRPATPLLSRNVDLTAILGSTEAFVGFTSATGGARANHDVLSWEFRDSFAPVGVPDGGSSALILGLALLGIGALKTKKHKS